MLHAGFAYCSNFCLENLVGILFFVEVLDQTMPSWKNCLDHQKDLLQDLVGAY